MNRAILPALLLASCAAYRGPGHHFDPARLDREDGWLTAGDVPLIRQQGDSDCGAAALAMVLGYWQRPLGGAELAEARKLGPRGGAPAGHLRDLRYELRRGRPVMVGMLKRHGDRLLAHYEVVVAIHPTRGVVVTLDPARGWQEYDVAGFLQEWKPTQQLALVVTGRR
ncbi:MAG TPA: cysteine peptidase family C39 domain-containing protein [Kofleriaceae bacterium]|nr:cysteine peptidase family C39 domain-containing protein [Kofleriaceae bacterium]